MKAITYYSENKLDTKIKKYITKENTLYIESRLQQI